MLLRFIFVGNAKGWEKEEVALFSCVLERDTGVLAKPLYFNGCFQSIG